MTLLNGARLALGAVALLQPRRLAAWWGADPGSGATVWAVRVLVPDTSPKPSPRPCIPPQAPEPSAVPSTSCTPPACWAPRWCPRACAGPP